MAEVQRKHLRVSDPSVLLISHSSYSGKTPAEARRLIKIELDKLHFGITPDPISAQRASRQLAGGELPDRVAGNAVSEGITFVRCYYDGTENTGEIKHGKPVVFDTVKGWGVTGIHESWQPDEYKILGIALDNYSDTAEEGGRIAVRLVPEQKGAAITGALLAIVKEEEVLEPYDPYTIPGIDPDGYPQAELDILGRYLYGDSIKTDESVLELPSCNAVIYQPVIRSDKAYYHYVEEAKIYNTTPWKYKPSLENFVGGAENFIRSDIVRIEKHGSIYLVTKPYNWHPAALFIASEYDETSPALDRLKLKIQETPTVYDYGQHVNNDALGNVARVSDKEGWEGCVVITAPGIRIYTISVDIWVGYAGTSSGTNNGFLSVATIVGVPSWAGRVSDRIEFTSGFANVAPGFTQRRTSFHMETKKIMATGAHIGIQLRNSRDISPSEDVPHEEVFVQAWIQITPDHV